MLLLKSRNFFVAFLFEQPAKKSGKTGMERMCITNVVFCRYLFSLNDWYLLTIYIYIYIMIRAEEVTTSSRKAFSKFCTVLLKNHK